MPGFPKYAIPKHIFPWVMGELNVCYWCNHNISFMSGVTRNVHFLNIIGHDDKVKVLLLFKEKSGKTILKP